MNGFFCMDHRNIIQVSTNTLMLCQDPVHMSKYSWWSMYFYKHESIHANQSHLSTEISHTPLYGTSIFDHLLTTIGTQVHGRVHKWRVIFLWLMYRLLLKMKLLFLDQKIQLDSFYFLDIQTFISKS